MNISSTASPRSSPATMFPQYRLFLCGIHFIQSNLNEAYKHRSVEKMKMPSMEAIDRIMPASLTTPNQLYDKKWLREAQKYFRKWAAFLHHFPGFFPLVIKRDMDEHFKSNDTVGHVTKFALSMARNHMLCKVFEARTNVASHKNSSSSAACFESHFEELKRWNFGEEDVVFMNILHQAVHPYVDEHVLESRYVRIADTNVTIPYGTEDMCSESV